MELINISAAQPWLFMQAMWGLMRRSSKDNVLTKVGYLLKDKIIFQIPWISRARPRMRRYWSEPLETFRCMTAHEWAYLSGRAQMWFPLICCVKVLTPHMLFVVSALWIELETWCANKWRLMDWHQNVSRELWGFNQSLVNHKQVFECYIEYLERQNVRNSGARGLCKNDQDFWKGWGSFFSCPKCIFYLPSFLIYLINT